MPRYFLQLRHKNEELLDEEGREYASLDDIRTAVRKAVLELISEDVLGGVLDLRYHLDAEDKDGSIIYSLPYAEALEIIPA